jgi:tetratricopeptide (TPR) repeat protein
MPPEQAMGGEVIPQSDLYSLGAMLYEMVCGRPPFVGDESVAIIGQHLNTPPVAPSWHRPDCPPGLEALILRLLEKDASKRPASAAEVREALASISTATVAASVHEQVTSPHEHEPLYRRVFVGREQEVRQLQRAFDAAMSGQGGLIMVVGEPGIGKTSIVEQLETYVRLRGGMTLVGHCYEEGSLSLPYLPFIEAMRSYVLERDADGLRSDLGSGASEVARIVSEVRDKVSVTPSASGDPEEQRWRLMEAVKEFLRNASRVQPLLVELEDLHDSDRGTLDLLVHLARSLEGARLLIVGTYRDVEVDRAHPLSGALAELRRGREFQRIPLRGLTVDEVHRLYTAIRGHEVPRAQAEAVHRQTEGNPLFIIEVLRYLVEEGLVVRQDGRYDPVEGQGPGDRLPEGLRDVIGKRLSLLSERTNQVLSVAAVIGREFRLDVLQLVTDQSEDEVIEALEQATERAVVEVRSSVAANLSYRFTHAFFRQTLYEELSPPRRIRMHQQVARALEQVYGRRIDEHAVELAEHYSYSSDPADLTRAVEYGELAASRAMSVYAYGEAASHLTRALEVQAVLDPDNKAKRCTLLLALGDALLPAGEYTRIADTVAPEAFALALELKDAALSSKACLLALSTFFYFGIGNVTRLEEELGWAELADRHVPLNTVERVRADSLRAFAFRRASRPAEAWQLWNEAYDLAERLNDEEGLAYAGAFIIAAQEAPLDEYERVAEVAQRLYLRNLTPKRSDAGYYHELASALLSTGDRADAENVWDRLAVLAEHTRDAGAMAFASQAAALRLTLDGKFGEVLDTAQESLDRAIELGIEGTGRTLFGQRVRRPLLYLGRYEEALATVRQFPDILVAGGVFATQRAYLLAYLGHREEATEILNVFMSRIDSGEHVGAPTYRYILEAAVALRDERACRKLVERMRPLAPHCFTEASMCFCIARHLGEASTIVGEIKQPRTYFEQAIAVTEQIRFRPEVALSRLGLAELLLDHYPEEHDAAIGHLDFAIAELRDMKMQPALERALGRRGLLKA